MSIHIRNIVFSGPEPAEDLGTFWAHLLGWKVIRRDWFVVAAGEDALPRLAFDGDADYQPPQWPDPDHPQQMHLDIAVPDLVAAADLALTLGGTELRDSGAYRVYADPAGHPFCLYEPHEIEVVSPQITHIVLDCFSPRSLARFYEGLLGMTRLQDTPEWVVIGNEESDSPRLSFQHSRSAPPRWPDPAYPQQLHVDFHVDSTDARDLALTLGAMPLPAMGGSCPVFADPAGHPFCLCGAGE